MVETLDLIIRGGEVFTPSGLERVDIGVRDGRIAILGNATGWSAGETVEAAGLTVLPGVIDTQVHFREPGLDEKEDLESGTRAAAMGGVTAVFEMPNTSPPTTTATALAEKLQRAEGRTWTDHAFYVGAAAENIGELPTLERLPGCAGVKIFMGSSTGSLLVSDDDTLLRVLRAGQRRAAVHAEDEFRMRERAETSRRDNDVASHPEWRDVETAVRATRRILALARRAGRRIHVLHITTADEIAILQEHKDVASCEVTPQHLTLAAPECYAELGSKAQMNPPIREGRHRDGLWEGVRQGVFDVVGSDHAPHTIEEKAKPYPASPSGMPGVQTLLPLLLDHLAAGRLSLARLVDLTSAGAVRIFGIAGKGRIAAGFDADFTLVDLQARRTIENGWLQSKCGWSPFEGREINGWPVGTIVRGRIVMREDELLGEPIGRPVRFQDTLGES